MLRICSIIVTYGNRFHLLEKVINRILEEGISKIIVVDNDSHVKTKEKLKELKKSLKNKLEVIELKENKGSAGGIKEGLKKAYVDNECQFIWILDDDNFPLPNSLQNLINFWNSLEIKDKHKNVALLSFRRNRYKYLDDTIEGNINNILGRIDSFLGFHFKEIPKKILRKIFHKKKKTSLKKSKVIEVPIAPYGGLFFHKELLNNIGLPLEAFYLYSDDTEWTYRITSKKGKIFLVLDSEIKDLEDSWILKEKISFLTHLKTKHPVRLYYSVRNKVFFEKRNRVKNRFIYYLNIFLYFAILKFFYLLIISTNTENRKELHNNLKIFKRALKDGLQGNLGKNEDLDF